MMRLRWPNGKCVLGWHCWHREGETALVWRKQSLRCRQPERVKGEAQVCCVCGWRRRGVWTRPSTFERIGPLHPPHE